MGKIATIQVTVPTNPRRTYVFNLHAIAKKNQRLIKAADIPAAIKNLLESRTLSKVGCNVATDARKLKADYDITLVSPVDICLLARDKGLMDRAKVSLQEMACRFLGADLPKGELCD